MKSPTVSALRLLLIFTILTGVLYPLAVTGISTLLFPAQAKGVLVERDGKIIGSSLIAQKFADEKYFWSRPSAVDDNPMPSGASNLGPTSEALKQAVEERRQKLQAAHPTHTNETVPKDLLFASASGLDPHLSPGAVRYQMDRVAQARNLDGDQKAKLVQLVESFVEARQWGVFGDPRVNVLNLNLALDAAFPK